MEVKFLEKNYCSFANFLKKPPSHNEIDPHYPNCYDYLDIITVKPNPIAWGKRQKNIQVIAMCIYHKLNYEYRAIIKSKRK